MCKRYIYKRLICVYKKRVYFLFAFTLNQLTSRNMCFRCRRVSCGDNYEISGVSGHEYDNRRV